MTEEENAKRKKIEDELKLKKKMNQKELKDQMGTANCGAGNDAAPKIALRGAMTEEELRLNKEILRKISEKKKLERIDPNAATHVQIPTGHNNASRYY